MPLSFKRFGTYMLSCHKVLKDLFPDLQDLTLRGLVIDPQAPIPLGVCLVTKIEIEWNPTLVLGD